MTNDNNQQQQQQSTTSAPVESKKRSNTEEQGTVHKRVRLRLIPIWLRILLVLLLFIVAATIGLMFGYAGLGDGNATDALKWSTWQHMLDIIRGVQ